MYVNPQSEITIGNVRLGAVHSVSIAQSVNSISNSAAITIPRAFKRKKGEGILDFVKVGDKVVIKLGYNEDLKTEFVGYVSVIHDETPIKIEIEDAWYLHKKNRLNKAWKRVKLKEVLQFVLLDYKIEGKDLDVELPGYVIKNASSYTVAKDLKEQYGFYIRINEEQKTLRCFFAYDVVGVENHTYVFGTRKTESLEQLRKRKLSPNVVKNDLEFSRKEDLKLCITAKGQDKAGKAISVTVGSKESGASNRTLNFGPGATEESLRGLAEKKLEKYSHDGYRGKITGFGVPTTQAGDTLQIVDADFPEREGSYLIKSVEVSYSPSSGFRRVNELEHKI